MTFEINAYAVGFALNTAQFRAAKSESDAQRLGRLIVASGGKIPPDSVLAEMEEKPLSEEDFAMLCKKIERRTTPMSPEEAEKLSQELAKDFA